MSIRWLGVAGLIGLVLGCADAGNMASAPVSMDDFEMAQEEAPMGGAMPAPAAPGMATGR